MQNGGATDLALALAIAARRAVSRFFDVVLVAGNGRLRLTLTVARRVVGHGLLLLLLERRLVSDYAKSVRKRGGEIEHHYQDETKTPGPDKQRGGGGTE